jgi:RNA polymerase sigma-70 factor, ECF subfamily
MALADPINVPDNEDSLILNAVEGDTEAFSALYEKYIGRIYNYLYYRTGNPFDAEDLTARVFHRALGHITNYQNKGIPFSAWLYRIAHNLVANWYRDNGRRQEVPLEDYGHVFSQQEPPESSLVQNYENERLIKAVRNLSGDRQQLIILKYVEHLSNAEIAVIMGRSEGAIKSFYHRTLMALREEMSKLEDVPEKKC